jgi:hypothetical protein
LQHLRLHLLRHLLHLPLLLSLPMDRDRPPQLVCFALHRNDLVR